MRRTSFVSAFFAILVLQGTAIAAAPAPAATPLTIQALPQDDVLGYIEELMRWQKDASSIETTTTTTREILLQDNLQQNALKILRSGFKFAKLDATLTPATAAPAADVAADGTTPELTPAERMRQRVEENDKQILQLQERIPKLPFKERDAVQSQLRLAVAKRQLYNSVLMNMRMSASGNGFADQLAKLEQSVPELDEDASNQASAKAAAAAATTAPAPLAAHTVDSVFTLAGSMFDTLRQQRALHNFADDTLHLEATSRALIKPLRKALDDVSAEASTDATIDEQVAAFNRIGSVLIPLGEATFNITATKATLEDWQRLLDQRLQATFRQFLIKLAILAITLAIPLAIGDVVRRAIKKYIRDPKRQRQANVARRILVSFAVLFILLFNFISDFSSFATFAGFMTAGLAVALQSVLLSLVAHFFFYGRYGVRAGDRVNVAGVTGDILQIGIVRFYMRELKKKEDGQLEYTGKTVAFPNSILFQPTAFYKYIPD